MRIGVPKEIKIHEYRVGMIPACVREAVAHGHEVHVQAGVAERQGISDEDYRRAGAKILKSPDEVFAMGVPRSSPGRMGSSVSNRGPGPERRPAGISFEEIRKAIAAAMAKSHREIPHYYVSSTIDISPLIAWLEGAQGRALFRPRQSGPWPGMPLSSLAPIRGELKGGPVLLSGHRRRTTGDAPTYKVSLKRSAVVGRQDGWSNSTSRLLIFHL
jgi:hypothetical protein